jgi:hypothetical protein
VAWFDKLVASSATHADYNAGEYIPIFSGEDAGLHFRHSDHLGSIPLRLLEHSGRINIMVGQLSTNGDNMFNRRKI